MTRSLATSSRPTGSALSPVSILDYFPLPNQAGTADGGNNYVNPTSVADESYYTVTTRIDHSLSSRHRIYGRYSWDFWEESKNNLFDNAATGIVLNRKNRVLGIDDAYTWRDNLLTNLRAGYTRQLFPERRQSQGFDVAGLGFSPTLVGLVDPAQATFPNVAISGYTPLGTWESGDGFFTTDVYNANGSLMWLLGNHNLKFGTEYRYYVEHASRYPTAVSPTLNFTNQWTRGPIDNAAGAPRGQDLASFMLGYPSGGSMSRAADYTEKNGVLSFYVHNDWRVRSNLTVNLGLRYEYESPLTESRDRMISGFDSVRAVADQRGGRSRLCALTDCGSAGAGVPRPWRRALPGHRRAWRSMAGRPQQLHAARRFLVAAGHGHRRARRLRALLRRARSEPHQRQPDGVFAGHSPVPSLDNGQTFIATLENPFPDGLLDPVGSGLGTMTNAGLAVSFPYVGEVRTPRTHRWSLGVQQELPWLFVGEVTYVGGYSENLPVARELNAVPGQFFSTSPVRDNATNNLLTQQVANPFVGLLPGTGINGATVARSQLLRPYPQFTRHRARDQRNIGLPILAGAPRATHGQRDHAAGRVHLVEDHDGDGVPQCVRRRAHRVIGAFDRTHMFVTSGIVELPFGQDRHWGRNWNTSSTRSSAAGRCRSCSSSRAGRLSASATISSGRG